LCCFISFCNRQENFHSGSHRHVTIEWFNLFWYALNLHAKIQRLN
jgi:hypothetical protein